MASSWALGGYSSWHWSDTLDGPALAKRPSLTSLLSSMEIHAQQEPREASAELSPSAPACPLLHLSPSLSCPDALTKASRWSSPSALARPLRLAKAISPSGSAGLPKGLAEEGGSRMDRSPAVWKLSRVVWPPFHLSNLQVLGGD